MALAANSLVASNDPVDATSFALAGLNPSASAILIAVVDNQHAAPANTVPTCSSSTLGAWTLIQSQGHDSSGSPNARITAFYAVTGSSPPTSEVITFDFGGETQGGIFYGVVEFTGGDTSSPIVQSAKTAYNGSTSNPVVTLAAFGGAANATVGMFAIADRLTATVGSGFTALQDNNYASTYGALQIEWLNGNDTSVDVTYSASPYVGAIAFELKAASGGSTSADASAAGTSSSIAEGSAASAGDLSATATSSVIAEGAASVVSEAYATGVSTVDAVGSATAAADGAASADGVSSALAEGASSVSVALFAAGVSTADWIGESTSSADAQSDGISTAIAVGEAVTAGSGVAYAAGTSSAYAVGEATDSAAAYATGTSTATMASPAVSTAKPSRSKFGRALAKKQRKKQLEQMQLDLRYQDDDDLEVIKMAFEMALAEYYKIAA